jgi:coenzyme F420-reducing hydrogenase delta subunit
MHSAYLRISTEDQSNFSLEAQEEIIRKYAASHQFQIVKTYTDDGVSAKNFNRPDWKRLELDLSKSKGQVKAILIVPEKAAIVRQMFENVAAGMDWKQAGQLARRNGFTLTGKDSVKWVLTNILYAGIIKVPAYGREPATEVKGIHEPIISTETFYRVQATLNGKPQPKQEVREEFPLRGIVKCKECNRAMTGGLRKGRLGTRYPYYNCNYCKGQNYNANKAHELLLEMLQQLSLHPSQIKALHIEAQQQMTRRLQARAQSTARLRTEIQDLSDKISQLEEKFITGKIADTVYNRWENTWGNNLRSKKAELELATADERQYWKFFRIYPDSKTSPPTTKPPKPSSNNASSAPCSITPSKSLVPVIEPRTSTHSYT